MVPGPDWIRMLVGGPPFNVIFSNLKALIRWLRTVTISPQNKRWWWRIRPLKMKTTKGGRNRKPSPSSSASALWMHLNYMFCVLSFHVSHSRWSSRGVEAILYCFSICQVDKFTWSGKPVLWNRFSWSESTWRSIQLSFLGVHCGRIPQAEQADTRLRYDASSLITKTRPIFCQVLPQFFAAARCIGIYNEYRTHTIRCHEQEPIVWGGMTNMLIGDPHFRCSS